VSQEFRVGAKLAALDFNDDKGFITPDSERADDAAIERAIDELELLVRGLFAMQCAARGLVAFARCAALHGMRCVGRCGALHGMRCNALRAGWLQLQAQVVPCF
jgi:hypothetical protein